MVRTERRQRVVIFAGAGASKAVNREEFPATREFFERLPHYVSDDTYFQMILRHLTEANPDTIIDIELILWELQKLYDFFKLVSDQKTVVNRAIRENVLYQLTRGWGFGELQAGAVPMMNGLKRTIDGINEQVYDFYSYEPSSSELRDNWNPLLKNLLDLGINVDVFTTNYDLVIESAFNDIGGSDLVNEYIGAAGNLQKRIDLQNWQENSVREAGLLTKLHGSLNWKRKGESIFIGDSIFTGSHEKQAIVYPGFKGLSDEPFFAPFHEYLSRRLAGADHLLVIGFAFRDDNIRQIFQTSLPREVTLTQFDPDEAVKLPTRRRVNRMKYFEQVSVEAFLQTVQKAGTRLS